MASGLQCPGCGHVHPAGLPEIVRGDATFRCYGCYRTLSVPEGWTGRPAPRPAPAPRPTADAPPGAGLRDARAARLANRRRTPADAGGEPTQMVSLGGAGTDTDWPAAGDAGWAPDVNDGAGSDWAAGAPAPNWPAAGATGAWAGPAGAAAPGSAGVAGARTAAGGSTGGLAGAVPGAGGSTGGLAGARAATAGAAAAPLGWVASRRSGRPVPAALRASVWAAAFAAGLFVSAYLLRKVGVLDVNTAIDLFAGTGPRRFGILVVMLPLWAVISAAIAHFSLEALARRRRPRPPARRPPSRTASPT
jgi:hypothetical protein